MIGWIVCVEVNVLFFFQAEDGIRYLVRSRGLGDVYKRQSLHDLYAEKEGLYDNDDDDDVDLGSWAYQIWNDACLLYTSDAADERSSVDLGGRRIIKKKKPWS